MEDRCVRWMGIKRLFIRHRTAGSPCNSHSDLHTVLMSCIQINDPRVQDMTVGYKPGRLPQPLPQLCSLRACTLPRLRPPTPRLRLGSGIQDSGFRFRVAMSYLKQDRAHAVDQTQDQTGRSFEHSDEA